MIELLLTIAFFNLLAAMTPGPDFAIVTRNTLAYTRQHGLLTALGVSIAVMIHASYCALGLALVITHTPWLFNLIKIIGGTYLISMGVQSLRSNTTSPLDSTQANTNTIRYRKAFWQGFITNIANPKCILFFLSLFTLIVQDAAVGWVDLAFILTFFIVTWLWFSSLVLLLSHACVAQALKCWQPVIIKITGLFLLGFGMALFFVSA